MSKVDSKLSKIYQFKISINKVYPTVWRRILLNENSTLADLHYYIQISMFWSDIHLHCFNIRNKEFGIYHDGGMLFDDDPKSLKLKEFCFYVNERFTYEYNFNDDWELELRLEKIVSSNKKNDYPKCIAGERAAPPEDCGGVEGFEELKSLYSADEIERQSSKIIDEIKHGEKNQSYIKSVMQKLVYWMDIYNLNIDSINKWFKQYFEKTIDWDDYIDGEVME